MDKWFLDADAPTFASFMLSRQFVWNNWTKAELTENFENIQIRIQKGSDPLWYELCKACYYKQKHRNRATQRDWLCRQQLRPVKRTTKRKIGPRWYKRHRRHPPRFFKNMKVPNILAVVFPNAAKKRNRLIRPVEILRLTNQKRSKNLK